MRVFILALIVTVVLAQQAYAQSFSDELRTLRPAAVEALPTLKKFVTEKNYKHMGFESPKEALSAELGLPFKEFMVRLDSLQKYNPDSDARELLSETGEVIYPVVVKKSVRSAMTLAKVKGEWKAVSFGGGNLYEIFDMVRKEHSRSAGVDQSTYFTVKVPALNLFFLAYHKAADLMLVPIFDNLEYGFKAGESKPANKAFTAILQAAKKHDGLPR